MRDRIITEREAELQAQLSAKKAQLSGLYSHLGKKYYEYHRSNPEPAFRSDMEAVRDAENEIALLEERLKKLQEGLICSSCGAELNSDDRFCPSCGAKISRDSTIQDKTTCPRCGNEILDGQKFCVKCGYSLFQDLEESIVNTASESLPNPAEPVEEIPAASAVCPNCGEPVEADMNFCISCGYRLNS